MSEVPLYGGSTGGFALGARRLCRCPCEDRHRDVRMLLMRVAQRGEVEQVRRTPAPPPPPVDHALLLVTGDQRAVVEHGAEERDIRGTCGRRGSRGRGRGRRTFCAAPIVGRSGLRSDVAQRCRFCSRERAALRAGESHIILRPALPSWWFGPFQVIVLSRT